MKLSDHKIIELEVYVKSHFHHNSNQSYIKAPLLATLIFLQWNNIKA